MVANGSLYTRVMEKLHFEPNIDESNITISIIDNGIVVLGGTVKSYTEKRLAEEAVEKIEKVRGVANELTVELATHCKRSDAHIVKAALDVLSWNTLIPHENIKVAVENGELTLIGEVPYNYQRELAQRLVQDLYGVSSVVNKIKLKTHVKPEDVKNKIIREFERNARIDANSIKVGVEGDTVILTGKVRNFDEIREARNAAWSVPGIVSVRDDLVII